MQPSSIPSGSSRHLPSCFLEAVRLSAEPHYDLGEIGRYYMRYQHLMIIGIACCLPAEYSMFATRMSLTTSRTRQGVSLPIAACHGTTAACHSTRPIGQCVLPAQARFGNRSTKAPSAAGGFYEAVSGRCWTPSAYLKRLFVKGSSRSIDAGNRPSPRIENKCRA